MGSLGCDIPGLSLPPRVAAGVNILVRKVGLSLTSYEEIKQDGDCWEIHITSTFKNAQLKFKLGEEFEEETMDGRKVKVCRV